MWENIFLKNDVLYRGESGMHMTFDNLCNQSCSDYLSLTPIRPPLSCVVLKFLDSLFILSLFIVLSAKRVSLAQTLADTVPFPDSSVKFVFGPCGY